MRTNFGKNVLRSSAFALACLGLTGTGASAGVMHTYSTSTTILGEGVTTSDGSTLATPPISFNPVATGSFTAPSAVGLGEFVVSTLPEGQSVSYDNTKFTINFNPVSIAGSPYPTDSAPVTITGKLNGTLSGGQSSVQATFDPITTPVFSSADKQYLSTLSVVNNPLNLVPASAGGRTTVQAAVVTTTPAPAGGGIDNQVPEPTTFAILATAMVGLGLRHRLRSARKSA